MAVLPRKARKHQRPTLWVLVLTHAFAFFLVVTVLGSPTSSHASDAQYSCPYLTDPSRRTIGELSQGGEGWFFREADFETPFRLTAATQDYLRRIHKAFADTGTHLVLINLPLRSVVASEYLRTDQPLQQDVDIEKIVRKYHAYIDQFRQAGMDIISPIEEARGSADDAEAFYYRRDIHWTPSGANMTAQRIAAHLKQHYSLPQKDLYTTKTLEKKALKSSTGAELQRLCTDEIPVEYSHIYRTELTGESGDALLFGDVEDKDVIAVIGSSFSAFPEFHFDGFLSDAMELEAINYAIPQGQLVKSIVSYSKLLPEERINPTFAVWETSSHYDFNREHASYRQVIPGIYGECSNEHAIATGSIKVSDGKSKDGWVIDEENLISGNEYYLYIHSDNPQLAAMTIEFDYADGDGEWFRIDHTSRYRNNGRFFVELREELRAELVKVAIKPLGNVSSNLQLKICKKSEEKV